MGINTQLNRAVEELIQFDNWDSTAIQRRQEMLANLARKVWEMPGGKDPSPADREAETN